MHHLGLLKKAVKLGPGVLAASLLACGGGGSSNTPPAAASSAPTQPAPTDPSTGGGPPPLVQYPVFVEPARISNVPGPTYSEAHRLSAFNRVNEVRGQAGLGLLKQNDRIDQAAQAHSHYQAINQGITHDEIPGQPGFTAVDPRTELNLSFEPVPGRLRVAGYLDEVEVTEVLASISSLYNRSGAEAIDSLMGTPYHRSAILSPQFSEMGVGFEQNATVSYLGVNLACTAANTQGAPELQDKVAIWPPAEATDVPTTMAPEIPNPIPENGLNGDVNRIPAGYAASVHVNNMFRVPFRQNWRLRLINANSFKIYEDASGAEVPTKVLAKNTDDPNRNYLEGGAAAALPRQALKKNTRYKVVFSGEVEEYYDFPADVIGTGLSARERTRTQVSRTWYFTTGNKITYSAQH